jgi:hypothetical protein
MISGEGFDRAGASIRPVPHAHHYWTAQHFFTHSDYSPVYLSSAHLLLFFWCWDRCFIATSQELGFLSCAAQSEITPENFLLSVQLPNPLSGARLHLLAHSAANHSGDDGFRDLPNCPAKSRSLTTTAPVGNRWCTSRA